MNKKFILGLLVTVSVTNAYFAYSKQNNEQIQNQENSINTNVVNSQNESLSSDQTKINSTTDDNKVLAKVDNIELTKKELTSRFGNMLPESKTDIDQLDEKIRNELIKTIVLSDLIHKEAENSSIAKSLEYKAKIAEKIKHVESGVFMEILIKQNINESILKQEYDKSAKEMANKEEVKAQHILVDKEEDAKLIESKLSKGESFEALAKEYSKDGSKDNGGELGYFAKGAMVKPFEDAAFSLKVGEVSPPVKSDFGWHIIKVTDKRKAPVPSFEEMKPNLERNLSQKFIQNYFEKILKDAKFEIVKTEKAK